ncbi:MAG: hypothetical protein GEV11_05575 [Streptosporangiales bacterium]|nr:hypothetical protein [Streptosporangiales bacterium]
MQHDDRGRGKRPLLTFRLDGELRRQLDRRLGTEGRTLSEVINRGLREYVGHVDPRPMGGASARRAAGPVTAVASPADLVLPPQIVALLKDLRESGESELLSASLAALHEKGWPLRPLAEALGISRQAAQARIRRPVPDEVRRRVPAYVPPPPYPRRRPAAPGARRQHFTVKIDRGLRTAARHKATHEGKSLTQIVERILRRYLRHGLPDEPRPPIELGDTTPTRPSRR